MRSSVTNKTADELLTMWDGLTAPAGHPQGGRAVVRVDMASPVPVFLARVFPGNGIAFLVDELEPDDLPSELQMRQSRGLVIRAEQATGSDLRKGCLVVELLENDNIDIFARLIEDILAGLASTASHRQAFRTVFKVIDRWRSFFSRTVSDMLSTAQQAGLFGELWFIRELTARGITIDRLIKGWTGPAGGNQDLSLNSSAIEVKTVTGNRDDQVEIHNLRQLDSVGLDHLFLARLAFDVRESRCNTETLPTLIAEIRDLAAGGSAELSAIFSERLRDAGYAPAHNEIYSCRGYSMRSMKIFHVQEGFPRITEGDVADGITDISYQITLDACRSYTVPVETMVPALKQNNG